MYRNELEKRAAARAYVEGFAKVAGDVADFAAIYGAQNAANNRALTEGMIARRDGLVGNPYENSPRNNAIIGGISFPLLSIIPLYGLSQIFPKRVALGAAGALGGLGALSGYLHGKSNRDAFAQGYGPGPVSEKAASAQAYVNGYLSLLQ